MFLEFHIGGVYFMFMQKHLICNFVFDSLQTSSFGVPRGLREISDQKIYRDKKFIEFNCREGLFYTNFLFTPLEQHVSGSLVPQGDLRSKNDIKQNILRTPFLEGSIWCKNAKFTNLNLIPYRQAHLTQILTTLRVIFIQWWFFA